jgi:hypothetical protein
MNKKAQEFWNKRWPLVLNGVGNDFVNELVRVAPVDSGDLRNSISYEVTGSGVNIKMNEYGYYVEFGTRPHEIRVKNAKVLSDGKRIFGRVVQHPGTEPNPFIRRTINSKLRNIVHKNIKRFMT